MIMWLQVSLQGQGGPLREPHALPTRGRTCRSAVIALRFAAGDAGSSPVGPAIGTQDHPRAA
jgi:hypothetical protein